MDGLISRKCSAVRLYCYFSERMRPKEKPKKKKKRGGNHLAQTYASEKNPKRSRRFCRYKARWLLPNVQKLGRLASEYNRLASTPRSEKLKA